MTKTNTANAADSAALASGSQLSGGLNQIVEINLMMWESFAAMQALLLIPLHESMYEWRDRATNLFNKWQATSYLRMWTVELSAFTKAHQSARKFAYANSGLDVPRKDIDRLKEGLKKDTPPPIFDWTDNQGRNTFAVDGPDGIPVVMGLIPVGTPFLVGIYWELCGFPPVPCFFPVLHGAIDWVSDEHIDSIADQIPEGDELGVISDSSMGQVSDILGSVKTVYLMGIVAIVPDSADITVTTRRTEPSANLRLWNMDYGPTITSSAMASVEGGDAFSGGYDVTLRAIDPVKQ